jgi:uncharacterized protein (TIGR03067 family)
MGGLLAADYAWRGERQVAGLVLLAPAFAIKPPPLDPADLLTPGFVSLISDLRLKPSTSEGSGFIKARRADTLALGKVSITSYLAVLGILQAEVALAAKEIKQPVLVCAAGKDQIVDSAATKRFYEGMAAPERQKTWRQWDQGFHTLCWDPVTPQLIDGVAQWATIVAIAEGKPGDAAKDKEHLQGLWQAVSLEANAEKASVDQVNKFQLHFMGDKVVFLPKSDNREHAYDIDPKTKPKSMDITPGDGEKKGQKMSCAIYDLTGDTLMICIDKEGKHGKRPTEFKTMAGDGLVLITLERVKQTK